MAAFLPSATVNSFHVAEPILPECLDLATALRPGAPPMHMVLLASEGFAINPYLSVLDAAFPAGIKVGDVARAGALLLGGGGVHRQGATGLLLSGGVTLDVIVSHGALKRGSIPITRSDEERGEMFELAGLPAADLVRRLRRMESVPQGPSAPLLFGMSTAPATAPDADTDIAVNLAGSSAAAEALAADPPAPPPIVIVGSVEGEACARGADARDGTPGASEPTALTFEPMRLPAGALRLGGTIELLTCDAALADEDLLVCAARYEHERRVRGAPPPAGGIVFSAVERRAFGVHADAEHLALRLGMGGEDGAGPRADERGAAGDEEFALTDARPSVAQLAPLPPLRGQRRQRTFAHSHTSVTVLFREAEASAGASAATMPLVIQQDGSRATHGGRLASITEGVLSRLTERPLPSETVPNMGLPSETCAADEPDTSNTAVPLALLGTLAFPRMISEFNIFEPRYRLLFRRLARLDGAEASPTAPSAFRFAIGERRADGSAPGLATMGMLVAHEEAADGRLWVRVRGLRRFAYTKTSVVPGSFGLWTATPEHFIDDDDDDTPIAPGGNATLAATLVEKLEAAAAKQGWSLQDVGDRVGERPPIDSATDLSWWFAHVLPAPPEIKRRWFEMTSASKRLRAIDGWMRSDLQS